MRFQYTQGVRSRFWYPVIHRFPSGTIELCWWKFRVTLRDHRHDTLTITYPPDNRLK